MSSFEFAPNVEPLVGAESADAVQFVPVADRADGSARMGTIDDWDQGDEGVQLATLAEGTSRNNSLP